MRMVSSDFSRRLCAFSVFSARILKATAGSGTSSAITVFTPSFLSAWSRWLPFGVKYWPSSRTATIGSRKMPIFSITVISLLTCASDASRWYGVGSTRSTGSADEQQRRAAERIAVAADDRAAVGLDLGGEPIEIGAAGLANLGGGQSDRRGRDFLAANGLFAWRHPRMIPGAARQPIRSGWQSSCSASFRGVE